ncbi:MAG: HAD family phosphatase [Chloroflexi bacterium]|nr:HAD family phosphatase [Chloroflexota bacterium]
MIRAIIFDLDGTLVQSEKLKALSYAIAVQKLRNLPEPDSRAIEAYREVVGSSREVASRHIIDALGLEPELLSAMDDGCSGSEPWETLTASRKKIYDEMVADPQVLRDNRWPHTISLLRLSKEIACRTGLATMSYRKEVEHVLQALDLERSLDIVLTREDVRCPKPDPEIYTLAARKLDVTPEECLVLEDSPNGVRSAIAAGMNVVAVATPFTRAVLHSTRVVKDAWIVHDPSEVLEAVKSRIAQLGQTAH